MAGEKISLVAWGTVIATAVAGGIWLGNLQTGQSAHQALPAHMAASRLIDNANQTTAVLGANMIHVRDEVDQLEEKIDRIERMVYEIRYGPGSGRGSDSGTSLEQ